MKKITLVLCACAMAFAGLLVSCSNDAGSGDVNLIKRDTTKYQYLYVLNGERTVTTKVGSSASDLVTTEVKTTFNGSASLTWDVDNNYTEDYKNYNLSVAPLLNENVSQKTTINNAAASTQPDPAFIDFYDYASEPVVPGQLGLIDLEFDFYEFDEKFYIGAADESNTAVYAAKEWKDYIEAGNPTVEVTGNIEEDDEVTITVTCAPKDTSTAPAQNSTKTVWTFKLSKPVASEE